MLTSRAGRAVLVALTVALTVGLSGATFAAAEPTAAAPSSTPFQIALAALVPPGTEIAAAPLPACRFADKRTRYYKVKHWRRTLLDTNLRVKRSYVPWDLVSVSRANIKGSGKVRKVMIDDLKAMARAARKAGKPLAVRSAYRSYATQVATFNSWVRRSGYQQALKFSARPGHSEHQMGTTIDFTVAPGQPLSSTFGTSKQGKWMNRNAWKFGFIKSYPKGKRKVSCYGYEPWHWRYVGREL
ncbi:MAG: D-alanyl-D-alanine carboxypeptidase family protein, partial [Chloroflexota bacterium]